MQTTAIIIFADVPAKASRHKKLLSDQQRNLALFEKLNRDIIATVKKTGIAYFVMDETMPEEELYGEHMANSIALAYDLGYENVIAVWNNCIGLDVACILKATAELQYTPLVVGPAHWGGVYLVGISKKIFHKGGFVSLNWESNLLAHDLCCYHEAKTVLPTLRVLNGPYSMKIIGLGNFFRPAVSVFNMGWHKLKMLPQKLYGTHGHVKLLSGVVE